MRVYTGTSIALVALEYFVHLSGDEPSDLVLLELQLPDGASRQAVALSGLPDQWQDDIAVTQGKGREWIESNRSLALQVPSAIVPEESNVLLNPAHLGWGQVEVRVARPFHFDRRMYKS
jgi:RES domain-containing protein